MSHVLNVEYHDEKFTIILDIEDYKDISSQGYYFCAAMRDGKMYCICKKYIGFINGISKYEEIYLHRMIMKTNKGQYVDHKDGNTLNNCKTNLRICNNQQNCSNQKIRSNNTSGYKGVYFSKKNKKFMAQININGKAKNLGSFISAKEAAIAYNKKAMEIHGEFAYLNKIEEPNENR